MIGLLKANRWFLLPYALFLVTGAGLMCAFEKGDEILYLNTLHTPLGDAFFLMATRIAEWPMFLFLLLYILFRNVRRGAVVSVNVLLVSLITNTLKTFVFYNQLRPAAWFKNSAVLQFPQRMEVLYHYSFPSGHTAAAFAFFLMMALLGAHKKYGALYFLAALLVAVSRVYLHQHFFRDVYFGSLLAVIFTLLSGHLLINHSLLSKIPLRNKGILR